MRKIALVYDAIYPFVKGGAERRFYELGKRLVDEQTEVHLFGMKLWDGPTTIQRDGMFLHGIGKARPLYTTSGRRSIKQAVLFGLSSFRLLRADFDVIDCCHTPYFALPPAKLAALLKRKPLFSTWHEVWGKRYWRDYLGKLGIIGYYTEVLATKIPDYIIASSQHTAELLNGRFHIEHEPVIVPNGIDHGAIANLVPSNQQSDLIYAGRLMEFKNVGLIIDALSILNAQGSRLTCTIVGEGPEKTRLLERAHDRGVSSQISWLGFLELSEDVYTRIKAARALVLPSQREGFGIVALEANACGIPVLTLNHPENAARHLVRDGRNGYCFEDRAGDLAEVIKLAMNISKSEWRNECEKAARDFDWANLAAAVSNVYAAR